MHPFDAYRAHLARLLAMPPLSDEAAGCATARLVLLPSFQPEASITLVAAPPDRARLIVRSLDRSAWVHIIATRGATWADPVRGFVEPAVATEEIEIEANEAALLVARLTAAAEQPHNLSLGLDGMPVEGELTNGSRVLTFECWCPTRTGDGLDQAVVDLIELAHRTVRWDASRTALDAVARYTR